VPPRLLYIEDNPSNLRLVERILKVKRPTVELFTAETGELGLAAAWARAPDAILLDLNLPDISGEEVLRRLRRQLGTSVPVAVVSADAMPGVVERILVEGADAYLTKPFELFEFLEVVDDLFATGSRRDR
jgi:CheY-like chemotaxis protein